jgi:hypothetical protein
MMTNLLNVRTQQDNSVNYQMILDHLGNILIDDKNINYLTSEEQKLEFIKKFLIIKNN